MLHKIGQYYSLSIVFTEGSWTDAKSKMEGFVLKINSWKPVAIVKKSLHIRVYIVSIYISVELLSDIDKKNNLTSKNNSDIMLKNDDVSSTL